MQNVTSVGAIDGSKSLLFLFSPKPIFDHFKRPLVYDFNHKFIDKVGEKLVDRPTMNGVNAIINDPVVLDSVKPAYDGFDIHTSKYSDKWTFILIIEDSTSTVRLPYRMIYYGMFEEEPITNTFSATPEQFINHNCQMVITRKVCINTAPSSVPSRPNHVTMNDVNVVNYDDSVWNGSDAVQRSFFTTTPSDVAKCLYNGGGDNSVVDYDDSINLNYQKDISVELEAPKRHIRSVLQDIELSIDNAVVANESPYEDPYSKMFDESVFMPDAIDTIIGSDNIASSMRKKSELINTTDVVTLGNIYNQFRPQIIPIETSVSSGDVIPQNIQSINNIFSSLVCSCMPSFMNTAGLSSVSFAFNSHSEAIKVLHIDSVFDDTQDVLKFKWYTLLTKLKTEMFPILMSNGGHFDITVLANVSDTVDVVLNFLDFPILPVGALYQENCLLGGITSPLIGTADHLAKNTSELSTLIHNVDVALTGGSKPDAIQIY